jgi:formamidopyrimidine-DNA glycosylase
MPELPEVQAIAQRLDERMAGQTIGSLVMYSVSALKTADVPLSALHGAKVNRCFRRGKFVLIDCGPFLTFHLARAGWVRWSNELKKPQKPSLKGPLAAQLFLENGAGFSLTEQGTQKRLSLYLVKTPQDVAPIARLGPDVLGDEFTVQALAKALSTGSSVKSALSDQRRISGIGNAYSDEILHVAKLSPFARSNSFEEQQIADLYRCIREVLSDAVTRASSLDLTELKDDKRSHMRVHRRDGEECPECGDTVRSVHYSARSFQYCPTCQTGGKVLADRRLSKLLR